MTAGCIVQRKIHPEEEAWARSEGEGEREESREKRSGEVAVPLSP